MTAPRWTSALLKGLAPPERVEDVLGDLEEAHRRRVEQRGRLLGSVRTGIETVDIAMTLAWRRLKQRRTHRTLRREPPMPRSRVSMLFSWLDFKLGFRMLVKYPGLTVIGVLAIAFAIAVGSGTFVFLVDGLHPTIPGIQPGERLIEIGYRNVRTGLPEERVAFDFRVWREELRTLHDLSAARRIQRNLETDDGRIEPVRGAEMTASTFRVIQVPPLLGRTLVSADAVIGAPPVIVLGYDVWRQRFDGGQDVIGREVRLGGEPYTVVGVMPEGFGFPYSHDVWTPLQLTGADTHPGDGPTLVVFGLLARGASLAEVEAELTPVLANIAATSPDTHARLRPLVRPFGSVITGVAVLSAHSLNIVLFLAFVLLISSNVALLVFARTAMREGEIVVRSALGASRSRIVMQLFAEALVLGAVAMIVGLMAGNVGLHWVVETMERVEGQLPYWFHDRLTPAAWLYAGVFTVVAAVVVGMLPALKATGRKAQERVQHVGARGSSLRMGGVWTAVIVAQIAFTVFFVRLAIEIGVDTNEIRTADLGFAAEEYLSGRLAMDPEMPSVPTIDTSRTASSPTFVTATRELTRRLMSEPGVRSVAFSGQLPGAYHPRGWIEVEDVPARGGPGHRAQMGLVDLSFFDVIGAAIVAGRAFTSADRDSDARVVIVNESFVRAILGERNAIGRRVRYLNDDFRSTLPSGDQQPGPWYEIVGVVRDVAMSVDPDLPHNGGVYHVMLAGEEGPVRIAVHVAGDPVAFTPRLQSLAVAANAALRLDEIQPMDEAQLPLFQTYDAWFRVLLLMCGLTLVLSNAGIYAIMSFAVSRRTREIGVRVALGANARRIVTSIFARSFVQVALGVLVGGVLLASVGAVRSSPRSIILFTTYISVMSVVCLLACVVPTRRALLIEPTEALRQE